MNLAVRDIRHNLGRFALTTIGIGLLLMIVMGMGGIYRGLIYEATLLVDQVGADFWVVQGSTRGPFAEVSRIPANLEHRVRAVPGVAQAQRFVSHIIQREHHGRALRMVVQGLSWPEDNGDWVPLIAGRALRQAHYELIADRSLGLAVGEKFKLGKDTYEVVGITRGMTGTAGDGLAFFTVADAMAVQFDVPGEATRLERASRLSRLENRDLGRVTPLLAERAMGPASELPAVAPPQVSAVLVKLEHGADAGKVVETLSTWPDVTVYSIEEQRNLLLSGMVDRSRRQLGLFRALLIVISTIIMALILYTLTLDKLHDIAMLKLIGARNNVIIGLILQQAVLMGALGYALAWWLGQFAFPRFPRLVRIENQDLLMLGGIVLTISFVASMLGIWKAVGVRTQQGSLGMNTMRNDTPAIVAEQLTKVYGSGNTEVVAMKDVSLSVARGEVVALLGPSGAGKSTLLTAIGLINPPTSGRISIGGELIMEADQPRVDLRTFRRRHLGFVFQKANLIPFLSALENVQVALEINDAPPRIARKRALELLDYLGVSDRARNLPDALSGGQQQRVAVARALANEPSLILADEPTAALDSHRGRQVMELFAKVAHERGSAVIVVTHDHRSLDVFDTTYEMEDGCLTSKNHHRNRK